MANISVNRGANNESISNINRAVIIQYLKRNGVCTRAEISKAIGLTGASITKIIASLIDYGIVTERDFTDTSTKRGNRSIGVSLNAEVYKVIAVKLSRRSFSVGVFDIGGSIYDRQSERIVQGNNIVEVADRIKRKIAEYLQKYGDIVSIGIAVPGPYIRKSGELLLMTEMDNWQNVPFKQQFQNVYNVPCFIEHDANAGALAEWWFGNQNHTTNKTLVHFLVGEGVGAGVITNGMMLTGSNGILGEIGHISIDIHGEQCKCGNYGCLEQYCSSIAFVKRAQILITKHPESSLCKVERLTAQDIFSAAISGDAVAQRLVDEVGTYIGYGIVTLVNAYDPDVIIVSNIMAGGGSRMLNAAKKVASERLFKCIYDNVSIEISDFKDDPILYGAAAVATDKFLRKPSDFLR